MRRIMGVMAASLIMFLAGISDALAFSTQTSKPVMDRAVSNRLADPEDLADQMSGSQTGASSTTVMHFGGMTTEFSNPPASPFLDNSTAGSGPVWSNC